MPMKTSAEEGSDADNLLASTSAVGKEDGKVEGRQVPGGSREESLLKLFTALFYAISSFLIMVVNKQVLTVHGFPSFQVLGLGQMCTSLLILAITRAFGLITFPGLSWDTLRKVWPLPLFYLGNMLFGLGSTKELSLPMLTVLRRLSILMTMVGEYLVFSKKPSTPVQMSVYLMIFGSFLAATHDLGFSAIGYTYVLISDLFTAANGVVTKQKLEVAELGKYGIVYYNALFMVVPTGLLCIQSGELVESLEFSGLSDPVFVAQLLLSCVLGFLLVLSTVLCTQYNSALTTTIIGCLKNILITYLGMFIGSDYKYNPVNFLGLNICVLGSLIYTKVTFTGKRQSVAPKVEKVQETV